MKYHCTKSSCFHLVRNTGFNFNGGQSTEEGKNIMSWSWLWKQYGEDKYRLLMHCSFSSMLCTLELYLFNISSELPDQAISSVEMEFTKDWEGKNSLGNNFFKRYHCTRISLGLFGIKDIEDCPHNREMDENNIERSFFLTNIFGVKQEVLFVLQEKTGDSFIDDNPPSFGIINCHLPYHTEWPTGHFFHFVPLVTQTRGLSLEMEGSYTRQSLPYKWLTHIRILFLTGFVTIKYVLDYSKRGNMPTI